MSLREFESAGKPTPFARQVIEYLNFRSGLLTREVKPHLMDGPEAAASFQQILGTSKPRCPLPMNKQAGAMKHQNYLTCMVNVLTERTLGGYYFDGDPQTLVTLLQSQKPRAVLSRRVDGAYPSTMNPKAIWEVKEYYDNRTFGSRIADGVYETLLDGYELRGLRETEGIDVEHYLIIDSRSTWWEGGGIPYLCRLVDALHMGLVDEVIVGREVLTRWPQIVRSWTPPESPRQ